MACQTAGQSPECGGSEDRVPGQSPGLLIVLRPSMTAASDSGPQESQEAALALLKGENCLRKGETTLF